MQSICKYLLLMIVLCATSCSSEEPSGTNEPVPDILAKVDKKLSPLVKNGTVKDVKDAIEFAKQFPEFTGSKCPSETFVSLYFGKYEYFIDFGGKSLLKSNGVKDRFDVASAMDEYDEKLGLTWSAVQPTQQSRAGSYTDIHSLLRKHNVMVWNTTAEQADFAEVTGDLRDFFCALREKGRVVEDTYVNYSTTENHNTAYMVNQLKEIPNYDVVYIICHGDEYGRLLLPRDGSFGEECPIGIVCNDDGSAEEFYVLTKEWFDKNLPNADLSKTVVWTATCYAFTEGGALYDFCDTKGVADFYGADQPVYWELSFGNFKKFYSAFINGTPSHCAYSHTRDPEVFESMDGDGYWCMIYPFHSVSYSWPFVKKVGREVKGTYLFYEGLVNNLFYGSGSRPVRSQSFAFGFSVTDKKDGAEKFYPVARSSDYEVKTFNDLSAVTLSFDPSTLPDGEYMCRTYIEDNDGYKQYSQNECIINVAKSQGSCVSLDYVGKSTYVETKYKDGTDWVFRLGPIERDDAERSITLYSVYEGANTKYFVTIHFTESFGESGNITFEVGQDFNINRVSIYDHTGAGYQGVIHSYIDNNVIYADVDYTGINPANNAMLKVAYSLQISLSDYQGLFKYDWSMTEPCDGNDKNAEYIYVREESGLLNWHKIYGANENYCLDYLKYPGDGSGDWIIYYKKQ